MPLIMGIQYLLLLKAPAFKERMCVKDEDGASDVCSDLSQLGCLMVQLYDELQRRQLWTLFDELEAPLSVILALLELRGLRVNTDVMYRSRDTLQVNSQCFLPARRLLARYLLGQRVRLSVCHSRYCV